VRESVGSAVIQYVCPAESNIGRPSGTKEVSVEELESFGIAMTNPEVIGSPVGRSESDELGRIEILTSDDDELV
jgi:hypothetical protein